MSKLFLIAFIGLGFTSFVYPHLSNEDVLNTGRRVLMIENEMTFIRNRLGMFEQGRIPNNYLVDEVRKSLDMIDFYLGNTELDGYED